MSPNYNVSGPNKGRLTNSMNSRLFSDSYYLFFLVVVGEYAKQANFGPDSDSYAPCGGPTVLKINTEINLNSESEANLGFSVIDSVCHHNSLNHLDR